MGDSVQMVIEVYNHEIKEKPAETVSIAMALLIYGMKMRYLLLNTLEN